QQNAGGMTERRHDFTGFVERAREFMHTIVVIERVHRPLAPDKENRVILALIQLTDWSRILNVLVVFWRTNKAQADQVTHRVFAIVSGVAPIIRNELPAVGAVNVHLIPALRKFPIGMGEFGPPKAYRPSSLL